MRPLTDLWAFASTKATENGHDLDGWVSPPGEETIARRAACRRCGRVVYVRVEDTMQGIAGGAVSEPCQP